MGDGHPPAIIISNKNATDSQLVQAATTTLGSQESVDYGDPEIISPVLAVVIYFTFIGSVAIHFTFIGSAAIQFTFIGSEIMSFRGKIRPV